MATYYINADTGNDGNAGGIGDPWLTLAHAFDNTIADDTIVCQDSTASYAFVTDTFDHNITLQGEQDDASGAVFDGSDGNVHWVIDATVIVERITIQNIISTNSTPILGRVVADRGVSLTLENVKIQDISIDDTGVTGGVIGGWCPTADFPFDVTLTNVQMSNIVRTTVADVGVLFRLRQIGGSTWIFTGVSIYITGVGAEAIQWVWDNGGAGFDITMTMKNCIISSAGGAPDWEDTAILGPGSTFTYCDFYNVTNSPAGTGNITSDPLFIDAPDNDLRLRPTSPCIDTGTLI